MQFIIITPNIIYILQSPIETLVMWVEKYIKCFVKYVLLTTISCHLSCSWQWMAFLWVSCVACSVAPPAPAVLLPSLPSCPLNLPIPSCPIWRLGRYRPDPRGQQASGPGEEVAVVGVRLGEGMLQWRGAGSSTSQSEQNSSIPNGNWMPRKCSWLDLVGGTKWAACISAVPPLPGRMDAFLDELWLEEVFIFKQ